MEGSKPESKEKQSEVKSFSKYALHNKPYTIQNYIYTFFSGL